jgi:hypothetical protein
MIRQTFRAFTGSALLLRKASEAATQAITQNETSKSVTIEINADHAINSLIALPAWTAFAVEIGFKTLLVSIGIDQKPRGHDLKKLFLRLPPPLQEELKFKTMENLQDTNDLNFHKLLENNRFTFEQWRYIHESNSIKSDLAFLLSLMIAIHNSTIPNEQSPQ